MKRIAASIALAALAVLGTAGQAEACKPKPVATCISALKWSHKVTGEARTDREDRAAITCGKVIKTERQAKKVYAWATKPGNRWALDILG